MSRIRVCLPTLNRFDLAIKAAISAATSIVKPDEVIVIDNSSNADGVQAFIPTMLQYPNIHVLPQFTNLGCGRAWNSCLDQYDDYIILINDDIELHPQSVGKLVDAAISDSTNFFFCGSHHSGNAFSCFLLKKWGYNLVGPFDRAFYPAYFEDNDYHWRMKLLGYDIVEVRDATYDHVGSGTVKAMNPEDREKHNKRFNDLARYYNMKWGGLPGYEVYEKPFNGAKLDL